MKFWCTRYKHYTYFEKFLYGIGVGMVLLFCAVIAVLYNSLTIPTAWEGSTECITAFVIFGMIIAWIQAFLTMDSCPKDDR
jgi:hypothetical protein